MKANNGITGVLKYFVLLLFSITVFWGCDSSKESAENVLEKTNDAISETAEKVDEVAKETIENVSDEAEKMVEQIKLVGTWSGKFDSRATTLIIEEQNGNDFTGKITINYKSIINQEVKGTFNPETKEVVMQDQLRSRYKGSYKGKLSEDNLNISGVFTVKLDGNKKNFNLKKIK